MITSGIKYLDSVTGGFKSGDNVIWQVEHSAPVDYFIRDYFKNDHPFNRNVVYVNFNYSPLTVCKKFPSIFQGRNVTLIDAFTMGKGRGDEVFLDFYREDVYPEVKKILVQKPDDIHSFITEVNAVENVNRDGSFYIFDSLTGMNELWKNEKSVLDFFAFSCPKLYDLNTIAFWLLEKEAHSKEFLAGISHITQIVFNLDESRTGEFRIKINKLDQRESSRDSGTGIFRITGDEISFVEKRTEINLKIGEKTRDLRKSLNMTQTDMAERLNLTSGALSQIENGLVSPSLNTLVSIAELLGKPLEYFLGDTEEKNSPQQNVIIQRRMIPVETKFKSAEVFKFSIDGKTPFQGYSIRLKENADIDSPIILHKGAEFIFVISGRIKISTGNEELILAKGESVCVRDSFIDRMTSLDDSPSEILYLLLPN